MGFFDKVNTDLISKCSSCNARTKCNHPHLENFKGTNDILLLFGAVEKIEDLTGRPFESNTYDWYREKFKQIGIDFDSCSKAHIVSCYTDSSATLNKLKKNCISQTIEFIKEVKPRLILAFGEDTLECTIALDYTRDIGSTVKWRGFLIPYRHYGFPVWLMHTFSFNEVCLQESLQGIIRKKEAKDKKLITTPKEIEDAVSFHSNYKIAHRLFLTDIRNAFIKSRNPITEDPAKKIPIHVLKEKDEIIEYLRKTHDYLKENKNAIMTIDLETNGLKCYDADKKIYCGAIYANPELGCFGFPFNPVYAINKYDKKDNIPEADPDIVAELKHIAELNPRICGCNYKYDLIWLSVKLGVKLERCVWDTMVVAHLLDPRDGITSLKFCAYTYFGSVWETEAHEYLKSSEEDKDEYGTNAINNIFSAPYYTICKYNCIDVINTYYVMKEQYKQWLEFQNPNKWFAFKLFHKVIPVLAHMEMNGILIDMNKVEAGRKQCQDELKKIEERIKDDPVWIKWGEIVGVEKRSILSASQIIDVFINHMHLHPHGISMKEKAKADLEWLSKLVDQEPFIENILQYRWYTKALHTYLDGLKKETNDDGRIRCFFTINNVSSYRMASNSPNFQNMSSRDEKQVQLVKTCFVPDKNCSISSNDFSGLENCGSASICNDEYAISVIEGGTDLHKDNCLFAFCMTDDEFQALKKYDEENGTHYAKTARNGGKAASFSTLYGAGASTIALTLWKYLDEKNVHVTPTELAKDRVIRSLKMEEKYNASKKDKDKEEFYLDCYIEHANDFLKDFWNNRMSKTSSWQRNNMENYFKFGYAQYPIGLNIHGLFSSLTINNAVIQGSSSSITLWCLVMLDYLNNYFKVNTKLCNIIHDDIVQVVDNQELVKAMSIQKAVMEECTRFAFPWLKFNLKAECETSTISWADKKEYTEFLDYYKRNKDKIVEAIGKAIDYDWTFKKWR